MKIPEVLIARGPLPVLVSVTVNDWDPRPSTAENVRLEGDREATGMPAVPMPAKLTVWGLPAALSVSCNVAVRVPLAPGVKVTLTVQLASGSTEPEQLSVSTKSPGLLPPKLMVLIIKSLVPALVTVTA